MIERHRHSQCPGCMIQTLRFPYNTDSSTYYRLLAKLNTSLNSKCYSSLVWSGAKSFDILCPQNYICRDLTKMHKLAIHLHPRSFLHHEVRCLHVGGGCWTGGVAGARWPRAPPTHPRRRAAGEFLPHAAGGIRAGWGMPARLNRGLAGAAAAHTGARCCGRRHRCVACTRVLPTGAPRHRAGLLAGSTRVAAARMRLRTARKRRPGPARPAAAAVAARRQKRISGMSPERTKHARLRRCLPRRRHRACPAGKHNGPGLQRSRARELVLDGFQLHMSLRGLQRPLPALGTYCSVSHQR